MWNDPWVRALWAFLAAAVLALGAAIALGRARRLRAHMAAVAAFVILFLAAVAFAEAVGRRYRFDPTLEGIHLPIAIAGAIATLLPLVTGWRRWRGRGSLRAHRIAILVFLVLFLAAAATGILMIRTGAPR